MTRTPANARKPNRSGSQGVRATSGRTPAALNGEGEATSERRSVLLEDAARLFGKRGFDKTSMRDIATAFGVLPGSLYHYFGSKDELFIAVYTSGVDQIIASVESAIADLTDPWDRLEQACVAHLQELLAEENVMAGVLANWPTTDAKLRNALVRQRDRYERLLDRLIDAVELAPGTERRYFRLALLGAINWALTWYKPGRETPPSIARKLVAIFRPAAGRAPDARSGLHATRRRTSLAA